MNTTHLFVDEAGDTALFGKHGKVLVGTAVTSRFFLVGRLEVADLQALASGLASHDIPEVRHAVFSLLRKHDLKFSAVVRDKQVLMEEVKAHMSTTPAYRYKADGHELYDQLIARLFHRCGQFGSHREVTFAVRGSKPRTAALSTVLEEIDRGFAADFGFAPHAHTSVHSRFPSKSARLQACDYLLWALQRFYERKEERHLLAMWPCFTQVLDLDVPIAQPRRKGPTHQATEFNEKHPLNLASRAGV